MSLESFEQSPISKGAIHSPVKGTLDCSTPIKKDSENGSSLSYSTPEVFHNQASLVLQSLDYLRRAQFSAIQTNKQTRKPRVNFHSIDELASTDSLVADSFTDSGFSSFSNQSYNFCSNFNSKSMPITGEDSDSEEIESSENKENESKNVQSISNKKVRTSFTESQKRALDMYFQRNPYPDPRETEDLSQQLVLPENVIKVWFQNKRSRDKQRKFSNRARLSRDCELTSPSNSSQSLRNASSFSSPLVSNLQMLTSRFNSYAAAVASMHNSTSQTQNLGKFYF